MVSREAVFGQQESQQASPEQHPVLGHSVEDDLEPKLAWLEDGLQLDDKSLCKLVQARAAVLGCSVEVSLEPKLAWLQERLSLDDKSLSELVQKQPSLFGCDVASNLEPTIKFFKDSVGSKFAIPCIANNPRVTCSSLENRLKPRLVEFQEAGVLIDTGTIQGVATCPESQWSNSMIFQKKQLPLEEQLQRGRQERKLPNITF
jgi:hypothetical protein